MKVVIFCGGKGLRLRDFSETIPKPMVPVGPRPIIWHTMKYYAYHGHKEFILALGACAIIWLRMTCSCAAMPIASRTLRLTT